MKEESSIEERLIEQLSDILYYRAMDAHDASAGGNLTTTVFCESVLIHFEAEGVADMLHHFSPENFVWRLNNGFNPLVAELN